MSIHISAKLCVPLTSSKVLSTRKCKGKTRFSFAFLSFMRTFAVMKIHAPLFPLALCLIVGIVLSDYLHDWLVALVGYPTWTAGLAALGIAVVATALLYRWPRWQTAGIWLCCLLLGLTLGALADGGHLAVLSVVRFDFRDTPAAGIGRHMAEGAHGAGSSGRQRASSQGALGGTGRADGYRASQAEGTHPPRCGQRKDCNRSRTANQHRRPPDTRMAVRPFQLPPPSAVPRVHG